MKDDREMLEEQLKSHEGQLKGLNSYIKELKDRVAEYGTQKENFEESLMEAENNVKYYEGEVAQVKALMGKETNGKAYWVYKDAAGEWRWQLRAANNLIIADSGEGYQNKQDCLHGIELVKNSNDAPVKEK